MTERDNNSHHSHHNPQWRSMWEILTIKKIAKNLDQKLIFTSFEAQKNNFRVQKGAKIKKYVKNMAPKFKNTLKMAPKF